MSETPAIYNPNPAPLPAVADSFTQAQRQAKALASSNLVPPSYRDNLPNCLIALELAGRIGASPFAVMQNLHIISGRPSWSSSFLIATVNSSGRFSPLRFEVKGEDPKKPDYKVRAYAKDMKSGELCVGTWITWPMIKAEKWDSKAGSKWLTMEEQMFMYRAAGFWSRVYAPEISLGMLTSEEAQDVWGGNADIQVAAPVNVPGAAEALSAHLLGIEAPEAEQTTLLVDAATGEVLPDSLQGPA